MSLFKPNPKLVALAAAIVGIQMLMAVGSSDSVDGNDTQGSVATQKADDSCEYGNVAECRDQCERGNGDSCSTLGVMYVNGASVERDEVAAGKLYQKACDLESAQGCYALHSALVHGVGMQKDADRATTIAGKACGLGNEDSCTFARRMRLVQDSSR